MIAPAFLCVAGTAMLALGAANAATVCDVRAYGAKADGTTMNTHAIQAAIDACATKGGRKVTLDGGIFLSGPIVLKTNIDLDTISASQI
jgi:polygalacturonase